ncbi:hypothetical protein Aperf_G00000082293 [Anoplocephala perfoliata]
MLACLTVYIVYREHRRKRKKTLDPLDTVPGDEEDEFNLYSPRKSFTDLKEKQLTELGVHTCQHLTKSQAHSPPPLQNGGVADINLCRHSALHHDGPHLCPTEASVNLPRGHSTNHSVKSGHLINSLISRRESLHCPTCPCGHTLIITSPALPMMQIPAAHNHSRTSSRRTSYVSDAKERMQKISIV